VVFDHSVLKAFSPYFAGLYFVRNKTEGWKSLGGILLAFTGKNPHRIDRQPTLTQLLGVEALFADLGAFSKK
jgi:KUP system potassium uptake protein